MASLRLLYFLVATAPRIAAPKSTDSLSLGRIIGQPGKIIYAIQYFKKRNTHTLHLTIHVIPYHLVARKVTVIFIDELKH